MQKTIFITGAGRGIGKATAQLFAQKGWFLGLLDINSEELEALAQEIGPENCLSYQADVSKEAEVEAAFAEFGKQVGGKLDVLFNNAGILLAGGFEIPSLAQHKKVVDVNFNGVMIVAYYALPLLKASPQSVLINMASISALHGNPELTAYAATKSAVKSLTEAWYYLYGKHDIHVCDILPGYTNTAMLEHAEKNHGGKP